MSFIEHLTELRTRLIRCLIAIALLFVPMSFFAQEIYTFVATPLIEALPTGQQMIATQVTSTFFVPFKLTFFCALALAAPVILHQVWSFIAPGLYSHEKKIVTPILVSSVFLFYLGICFAFYLVFPVLLNFFAAMAPEGVQFMPDIQEYLSVALKLFFAFGLAFEIPVAIILLLQAGVVTVEGLSNARPYIVIGCFIFGMLLTPPDIFSQTLLAIPMWALFEAGLIIGKRLASNHDV